MRLSSAQPPSAISPSKSRAKEHFLWRVLHFSHNYIAMQDKKMRREVMVECSERYWLKKKRKKKLCLIPEALVKVQRRDRPVCFFVCMPFNITIVLCFAPSLFLRNCRTERASATSSPSGLWAWSHGHERLCPHPAWPVTSSATTPSRPSRLLTWRWGRTITEGRGPSAQLPQCTRQRKVRYRLDSTASESDA